MDREGDDHQDMAQPASRSASRSTSVENYLKEIYSLGERDDRPVTTSRLSERLGLSASSVSGMLRKLAAQGLVDHRPYSDVALTGPGRVAALQIVRRHRLIEMFLVAQLGYSWDEVDEEAESMEHGVSDLMVQRMDAALGQPQYDPHGDPIPSIDGELPPMNAQRLINVAPGHTGRLVRVDDDDPAVLRHLSEAGIQLGHKVKLVNQLPFHGPYIVEINDGDTHQLGPTLAEALWIEQRMNCSTDRAGQASSR